MAALINIFNALRDKLSDNGWANKVHIGRELPNIFICPYIQIVGMTDNYDEFFFSNATARINVYLMGDSQNQPPLEQFAINLGSIFDLINETQITISDGELVRIYADSRDAEPIKDLSFRGQINRYFQGISWRMLSK